MLISYTWKYASKACYRSYIMLGRYDRGIRRSDQKEKGVDVHYSDRVKTEAKQELDQEIFQNQVAEYKEKLRSKRSRSLFQKLIPFKIVRR